MTVRIISTGMLHEDPQLGTLSPLYSGFQDPDALYLFRDGALDGAWAGPVKDWSSNANDGTQMGGASAPVRRAWGLEATSDDGMAVLTPFAWQGDFTVIIAGRNSKGDGPSLGFPNFFGCTQGMGADLSFSNSRNHGIFIDIDINLDSTTGPMHIGIKSGAANFVSGASRRFIVNNGVDKQDPFVIALCIDQTSKTIRLKSFTNELTLPGETAVCAAVAAGTGYFAAGIFKGGGLDVAGGISVCAIWLGQGDMSEEDVMFNMEAARVRVDQDAVTSDTVALAALPANVAAALALKANTNMNNVTSPGVIGPYDHTSGTASGAQSTITMLHSVPAGKEAWVRLVIGGFVQRPGVDYTCNGSTTLTLVGFSLASGNSWSLTHLLGPA